jgi:hypothetical protein
MTKFTPQERDNLSQREMAVWAAAYSTAYTERVMVVEAIVVADQAVYYLRAAEQKDKVYVYFDSL